MKKTWHLLWILTPLIFAMAGAAMEIWHLEAAAHYFYVVAIIIAVTP